MADYNHIILQGRSVSLPYSPFGNPRFVKRDIGNRNSHGNRLHNEFETAVNEFTEGDTSYDFVYIEFESAVNFELDLSGFEPATGDFRIASCTEIILNEGNEDSIYFRVAVFLNKKAVKTFLEKIEKYLTPSKDTKGGRPSYESLLANIEKIRSATLASFWQEIDVPFPTDDQDVWWEIWLDRSVDQDAPKLDFYTKLRSSEVKIGKRVLAFPEHLVVLVKGTPRQLRTSLLYTMDLAEIRKPVETADFFTALDKSWQGEFIDDLVNRTQLVSDSNISVCLLDTGVNIANPLLSNIIHERNLDTVEPSWTKTDSTRHGHGTPMAGLISYNDLSMTLSESSNIRIFHHLESVKIIEGSQANDPDLYGKITIEAVSRGEILNPRNKRVVCMAITSSDFIHNGKPSSWSSAIDQIIFGEVNAPNDKLLLMISSGNLSSNDRLTSPLSNDDISIEDPAQAFNAITVGSFTMKDFIDPIAYPGAELLANKGSMAPCNATSIQWNKEWPRKPDIVMEGGNDGLWNGGICDPDSLKLLSTGNGGLGRSWLTVFGDTSASTALASRLTAELYYNYPNLWPETIRGLIIHTADWTSEMLNNRLIKELNTEEQRKLIARLGFGVPSILRAKNSANNSVTLISQQVLKPYKYEKSRVQPNEFHLHDLPWPTDILTSLAETRVTLTVSLSYFVEPNPGNKRYSNAASYRSHGLRFKMIDRNESEAKFRARVSKVIRSEQESYVAEGSENWILGSQIRDKGSFHKDIWQGNAADLAYRNKIAVYPVNGWWKTRKKLARYDKSVRYCLIVTISTEEQSVDIYTPILNQISISIDV